MNTLDEVRRFLNRIDEVNCGGCGIAALAIYRWLKKRNLLKGDEKFVFMYVYEDDVFSGNEKFFKGEYDELNAPSHIVLKIGDRLVDSTNRSNEMLEDRYNKKHLGISEEILLKTINHNSWNDSFYREENVPVIEKVLDINLNDVILEFE